MKNYSGTDLSQQDKKKLRGWISEIKKVLTEKGCTNLDFYYGFHFIGGFFTSKDGQMFNIGTYDTRFGDFKIYYRTVKSYKDYSGGTNITYSSISELKDAEI